MNPNFEAYNLEDFICDESFQKWAKSIGSSEEVQSWDKIYASSEHMQKVMTEAKLAVLTLSRTEPEVDPVTIDESWEKLSQRIDRPARTISLKYFMRYAAVLVAFILSALWAFMEFGGSPTYVSYHAEYGQKKEITLPDGSRVTLNANSTLKTYENWNSSNREVWLEKGEAFFQISRTAEEDRFVVNVDHVQVEVLGTKFNINKLSSAIEVMLSEGKIRLTSPKADEILSPGELAVVDQSGLLQIQEVNTAEYDAWTRNSLVLDNKSLAEICSLIESQYGISVHLADDIKDRMVAGEIPNVNQEDLLKALEVALSLNISKSGDAILITKQNP